MGNERARSLKGGRSLLINMPADGSPLPIVRKRESLRAIDKREWYHRFCVVM